MVARGFYEDLVHPSIGVHPVPSLPFKYSGVDRWTDRASPTLGQDTRDVLMRVLGKTPDECDQLEADGVIDSDKEKCAISEHPLPTRKHIHQCVLQRVAHVKRTGNVRRGNNY
jgi:hypothetical protein